jgi:hypothetical protein
MAEYREAKAESKRGSYKKLHHIEITPIKGENGGHLVEHHFHQDGNAYRQPEQHLFGKDGHSADGTHLMEHLSKHLKVAMPEASQEEHEGPESEVEAASEPASENVEA